VKVFGHIVQSPGTMGQLKITTRIHSSS